jgi:3-phenylpropionate/cinnamic acid dioxygenase small subunit
MTRRVVSNIEAYHSKVPSEVSAISYLLAYRSRPSAPEGGFCVAERQDLLRKTGSDWRLARRSVRLDNLMLCDGALSTLL